MRTRDPSRRPGVRGSWHDSGAVLGEIRAVVHLLARSQAPGTRDVILYLLVAQMLAASGHEGPPHRPIRPPRRTPRAPARGARHESLTGRRPRG